MKQKHVLRAMALFLCGCILSAALFGCGGKQTMEGAYSSVASETSDSSGENSSSMTVDVSNPDSEQESSAISSGISKPGSEPGSKPASKPNASQNTTSGSVTNSSGSVSQTLPVKNMNGRTFTFCAPSWEFFDLEEDWIKELQSKYNCKLKNLQLSDYSTLYSSILAGDPLADVITLSDTYFYKYVQKKLLLDLASTKYIDVNDSSLYITGNKPIFTVNGKTYGVINTYPFERVLAYNKSIIKGSDDLQTLADAGKLTWDKLYEILTKVSKSGVSGIAGQMYECDVLETFIEANGGRIFKRDGGLNFTYTLDSQNTRNAISYAQKLYTNGCIMPMNEGNYLYPQSQFSKGKVAVMIADSWNLVTIFNKAKFDVGIVLVPAGPNASSPLVEQTVFSCYSVPSTVEKPEDVGLIFAAWAKAANSREGKGSFLNYWKDIMDDEKNIKVLKQYMSVVDSGKAVVDYKNSVTSFYDDGLYGIQQETLFGNISAQSYLERVGSIYKSKAADFQ